MPFAFVPPVRRDGSPALPFTVVTPEVHWQEQLFDAVYSLRRVLKPGGTLRVSVPLARGDVNPATRRYADGRLFTDLPPSKLQLLLERSGFSMVHKEESDDSLGRPGIRWWSGDFRRMDESTETRQLAAAEEKP